MELLERHFDTAFDAPDGIKKLRALILALAMQGKLVPQDLNDPPATELLKLIEREKQLLVKSGKLKNSNVLPPVTELEETFTLPKSWVWVRLGAVAQHNSGKTLDSGRNSGTPRDYITTSNLYWGRFELDNVRQMLIRDEELERCTAKVGDLLVCEGGEAGRAAVWEQESEVCFQNHIHRVRFHATISPYYGFRFFEYLNVSGQIEKYRKGVGISNMSSKSLASIPFPLPPVAEQLRIIKKIDELMARCDALEKLRAERDAQRLAVHTAAVCQLLNVADTDGHIQAREFLGQHFGELYTVKEIVTELRKAILQLAVMGKLVPQDPKDPPVSELLKKIEAEKKQLVKARKIKEPKQSAPVSQERIPYMLPQAWKWIRVNDIVEVGTGSTPPTGNRDYYAGSIPWYTSSATNRPIADEPETFISDQAIRETNCKVFPAGSLIIALYGQGKTRGQISELPVAGATNQAIAAMVFYESSLPTKKYLKYFFVKIYEEIRSTAEGAAQPNLNVGKIKDTLVPLPPLQEQQRIIVKIDQLMALCDALDQQIEAASETQSAMLNAMMAQYGGQRCA
jgi:type I restriction enzyme S subunit